MKKMIYLFAVLLLNAGCKKEAQDLIFGQKPELRMQKAIGDVNSLISSAPNGWIATLATADGGGYGFYMDFDNNNQVVKMYGDLNNRTVQEFKESTYMVKQDMGVALVFDTHNHISLLNDPDPNVFGGVWGTGYRSDIEFIYERSTTDSLILRGKKYLQKLAMVKATVQQKNAYINADYQAAIERTKNFFVNNANPFVEFTSGSQVIKVSFRLDPSNVMATGKRISLTSFLPNGTINGIKQKFAFVINGIDLLGDGISLNGITFLRLRWKDNGTFAIYDSAGNEYLINNAIEPLAPIDKLWGIQFNSITSNHQVIYPGTSVDGAALLNSFHGYFDVNRVPRINIPGYSSFNYGHLTFTWNVAAKRLSLVARVSQNNNAVGWNIEAIYNYQVDANGRYTFTLNTPPADTALQNAVSRSALAQLFNFMLTNRVTFSYHVEGGIAYAKMTSVENPNIVMTFLL